MELSSPITRITGIGPKYEFLLEKLDIRTIGDLIYYFPFRYDDFSTCKTIVELKPNEEVTIEAEILNIDNIFTKFGKKITKASVSDQTGKLELTWFNQQYIKKTLIVGDIYRFSGKTSLFGKKITLIAPKFEKVDKSNINTARVVPIYSEIAGLNSSWLRQKISTVLPREDIKSQIDEFLPEELIAKFSLYKEYDAIKDIHFPPDLEIAKQARERLAFDELFFELLRVEERKNQWKQTYSGIKLLHKEYLDKFREFKWSLPFELTKSQDKAINEIFEDVANEHPMNRLLEGDVGSGKTIVAVAAAYLCHLNGFKTLYMAPTEILAKQHFDTFKKYLSSFGVEVVLQTGNTKDKAKTNNCIVIGTHAILYDKGLLENTGIVIIDEQHRFGVEQRATLLKATKDAKPNLLAMTATPIPRTLALTIYGDLNISVLDASPYKEREIVTKVIPETMREKTYAWICEKRLQAFIVCPFITPSQHESFENVKAAEDEYEKLKSGVFKNLNVGLLHGKMKQIEKDKIIQSFREGKITILVSTPVIEVGVDIPDATVIVIESAERYGLASLHQLRGRVGRAGQKSYCFIFQSGFSKKSYARLKNLEEIDSGLKLAELDMQYRGQGDVFGTMQHGYKQFKLAQLTDTELINKASSAISVLYKELSKHPKIVSRLKTQNAILIENN